MEISRHWRNKRQRYSLKGTMCLNPLCEEKIFPPRPICPNCHGETAIHPNKTAAGTIYKSTISLPTEVSSFSK